MFRASPSNRCHNVRGQLFIAETWWRFLHPSHAAYSSGDSNVHNFGVHGQGLLQTGAWQGVIATARNQTLLPGSGGMCNITGHVYAIYFLQFDRHNGREAVNSSSFCCQVACLCSLRAAISAARIDASGGRPAQAVAFWRASGRDCQRAVWLWGNGYLLKVTSRIIPQGLET